jgi:hypothetical protein
LNLASKPPDISSVRLNAAFASPVMVWPAFGEASGRVIPKPFAIAELAKAIRRLDCVIPPPMDQRGFNPSRPGHVPVSNCSCEEDELRRCDSKRHYNASDSATLRPEFGTHLPGVHPRRNLMLVSHPEWRDAYPEGLLDELQDDLAALADIDAEFDQMLERLERWRGTEDEKVELLTLLEERRELRRQPHVQRLATLHDQMLRATLYRDLRPLAA